MKKQIGLIVARDTQMTIGNNGRLPDWRLRDDMAFFKESTIGNPVIMGRKNFESLPPKFRPLIDRTNIVMTRQLDWQPGDVGNSSQIHVVHSLDDALEAAAAAPGTITWIIGGGEVYAKAIENQQPDLIYLTEVQGKFEGDIKCPPLKELWDYDLFFEKSFPVSDRNSHPFTIKKYSRKA
jgi:dihydrofolate reductase